MRDLHSEVSSNQMKISTTLSRMRKNAEEILAIVDKLQAGLYVSEDPEDTSNANEVALELAILGENIAERATDLELNEATFTRYIKRQQTKAAHSV